jgi:enoyl-CoA hydratase/carnithine racemase
VLWVTIDRPEVRNALHPPASAELTRAWDLLESDPDLRAAVVTGAGDHAFCAGFGFGGLTNRFVSKPIIAAVNGPAMGGGLEFALACDLIVAAETARFAFPEVALGLVPNAGGIQRLIRQIPTKRALLVILAGEPISAQEAFELGLVSKLVPADQLPSAARDLAEHLAAMPPLSVAAAREVARLAPDMPLADSLRYQYPAVDRMLEALNRAD